MIFIKSALCFTTLFFLNEEEQTLSNYSLAVKRANKLGGKKYRGSDFGGGIVFRGYDPSYLRKRITEMLGSILNKKLYVYEIQILRYKMSKQRYVFQTHVFLVLITLG